MICYTTTKPFMENTLMTIIPEDDENEVPETISVIPVKKINYLNNKDMLKEIHRSKNSFCEYIAPEYSDYDVIVEDIKDIFLPEIQEKGRIARAARITSKAFEAAKQAQLDELKAGTILAAKIEKPKLAEYKIKPETIPTEDLVYRVLGFDHIPMAPGRKKNPKSEADNYVKLNFAPFKHYIIEAGVAKEVGRSHSKKGKFSYEHGSITNKLAKMFILMVNKYAQRGNWRGYCVDVETEALTRRGWLSQSQITENDRILSYNGTSLAWSSIKSIYRGEFDGKMHHLTQQGFDSLITPNHKIVTTKGLIPVELLKTSDKVLMLADAVIDTEKFYEDSFVELMAWISTEGCYEFDQSGNIKRITIYQNHGAKADRIRACLSNLNFKFSENDKNKNIVFGVSREDSKKIIKELPTKNLPVEFIIKLTTSQRELFLNTLIDGDGWRAGDSGQLLRYVQKNKEHIDNFQLLCALTGRRSNVHYNDNRLSFGKPASYYTVNIFSKKKNKTNGDCINLNGGKNTGRDGKTQLGVSKLLHQNIPTVDYTGIVWCPETEYGCFVARRNNTVYLTGNTYLDEMKGQALLQLAQMGLQFDEYKSDNPFSYYTASVSNSFTRVLNLEKKNQDLRDDLLVDSGASPSFSRQLAVENDIRRLREEAQEAAKDDHDSAI